MKNWKKALVLLGVTGIGMQIISASPALNPPGEGPGIAIGKNSIATEENSLAIGSNATIIKWSQNSNTPEEVISAWAMAIGTNASAAGEGSIVFGKDALTGTRLKYAPIGNGASIQVSLNRGAAHAMALGTAAQAQTMDSIAIGHEAISGAYYGKRIDGAYQYVSNSGIAIGRGAKAVSSGGRLRGNDEKSNDSGIAIGYEAKSHGVGSIVLGYQAESWNTANIIIGFKAHSKQLMASQDGGVDHHPIMGVAIGTESELNGRFGIAIGAKSEAGEGKVYVNGSTTLLDSGNVALGYSAKANQFGSVALGAWAKTERDTTSYQKKEAPYSNILLYGTNDPTNANVPNPKTGSLVLGSVAVGGIYTDIFHHQKPFLRQVTGVADGTEATDAINLRQLQGLEKKLTDEFGLSANLSIKGQKGTSTKVFSLDANDTLTFIGGTGIDINVDVADKSITFSLHDQEIATNKNLRGPQGPQGEPGNRGPAGDPGRGISSAEVREDGNLYITYSDATEAVNVGKVRGEDGAAGDGFQAEAGKNIVLDTETKPGTTIIRTQEDVTHRQVTADSYRVGEIVYLDQQGLSAGQQVIRDVAPGVKDTDAVNVGQLREVEAGIAEVGESLNQLEGRVDGWYEESRNGHALNAALAALKPVSYNGRQRTQIMAGVGGYRGKQAVALGVGHYRDTDTFLHAGLAYAGNSHLMWNAGASWLIGYVDKEQEISGKVGIVKRPIYMELERLQRDNAGLRAQVQDLHDEVAELKTKVERLLSAHGK